MNESKSLITQPVEPEYELLVNNISTLWEEAKNNAALSVNTELVRYVKNNFIQGRNFTNFTILNREAFRWGSIKNRQETRGKGYIPAFYRAFLTLFTSLEFASLPL